MPDGVPGVECEGVELLEFMTTSVTSSAVMSSEEELRDDELRRWWWCGGRFRGMDVLPCPLGAYHFWRMDDEQFGNFKEKYL